MGRVVCCLSKGLVYTTKYVLIPHGALVAKQEHYKTECRKKVVRAEGVSRGNVVMYHVPCGEIVY